MGNNGACHRLQTTRPMAELCCEAINKNILSQPSPPCDLQPETKRPCSIHAAMESGGTIKVRADGVRHISGF